MTAPPTPDQLRITPAGDAGLLVRLGDDISPGTFDRVMAALAALDPATWPPGWLDVLPGYASLLVVFDPVVTTGGEVRGLASSARWTRSRWRRHRPAGWWRCPSTTTPAWPPTWKPCRREAAPRSTSWSARHTAPLYLCHMLGFRPGFPFLGGLDPLLSTPRLSTPRTAVPAGSVAIGGRQTGIYPTTSPGGWRIIGRTPLRLFDPTRKNPFLIHPGDQVRFRAI